MLRTAPHETRNLLPVMVMGWYVILIVHVYLYPIRYWVCVGWCPLLLLFLYVAEVDRAVHNRTVGHFWRQVSYSNFFAFPSRHILYIPVTAQLCRVWIPIALSCPVARFAYVHYLLIWCRYVAWYRRFGSYVCRPPPDVMSRGSIRIYEMQLY